MPRPTEVVLAEPFARFLNERVAYWEKRLNCTTGAAGSAIERVCFELGWGGEAGARRLYRMRRQIAEEHRGMSRRKGVQGTRRLYTTDWFERKTVEDALFNAGARFDDLYPDIVAAEELELEPECWCPGCQESRTPINGVCPFCEWRVGPETGQVLRGRLLKRRLKAAA